MRCANPLCPTESSYLRDGSLYTIDEKQLQTGLLRKRFIWLCRKCAPNFVVETWRPPGQQLRCAAAAGVSGQMQEQRVPAADAPPTVEASLGLPRVRASNSRVHA